MKLYHSKLPDGQNICEVPDDAEGVVEIYEQSGWSTNVPKKYQNEESSTVAGSVPQEGGK